MADKRIDELPSATTLTNNGLLVFEQSGTAYKITISQLKEAVKPIPYNGEVS